MRTPGFTAEFALPAGGNPYHSPEPIRTAPAGDGVQPQFCFTDATGRVRCCQWYPYIGYICGGHPILAI